MRFSRLFVMLGFFACFITSRTFLFGESVAPFVMPSARTSAMGGAHAALADDVYSLFTNPAAFVGVEEEYSIAEMTVDMYGPVLEILDALVSADSSTNTVDLSGLVGKRGLAAGFDVGGPLALGWVGRGLGLGIFSRIRADAVMNGLNLRPAVFGEMFMVGGYSFRILNVSNHVLDIGFLGKGFFRGGMSLQAPIFDVDKLFADPLNNEYKTYLGLGLDGGIKYTLLENLSAALVCFDIYSPALVSTFSSYRAFQNQETPARSYGTIKPRLDLGLAYRIRSSFLDRYISRFSVMADYHDFLDLASLIPRNPILNVGVGIELLVLNVLSLRAGIADALPAAGIGLDLSFMKLDFAIYGRELGRDPGIQPVYALNFSLLFRY